VKEAERPGRCGARASRIGGVLVFAATFTLLVATGPKLAIVWDEGFTLGREARVRDWLHAVRDPERFAATWRPPSLFEELIQPDGRVPPQPSDIDIRAKVFSQNVIEWFWPFAREEPHGHPPFYAIVGLAGDLFVPSWELLARARLGPMFLFSLMAGSIFGFLARRWGFSGGFAAASAWVLQPRLFAHAHYAHYDDVLTSLWAGAILAFAAAVDPGERTPASRNPRWRWVALFGMVAGAAAGTKLTGWFLPLPFLAWALLYRDRRAGLTLLIGGLVGLVTLYLLTPPWWYDPIGGADRFLRSNLTRDVTTKIPTMFLGEIYLTPAGSLPWYNTLVWTLFVTPVGFLTLAMVGVASAIWRARSEPFGILLVGHWALLLGLRALPHTPGHDGERLFLVAFGCLALLAGRGACAVVARLGRLGAGFVLAAAAEGAISIVLLMPVPLSYFSPLVGGLPGAVWLGMEPTYYWDSVTDDAIEWLNAHTRPGQKVLFPTYPTIWRYLRQSGKLKPGALPHEPGEWTWYIVQNRRGALEPADRALIERSGASHVLVSKFGIPLLWAFPYAELEEARAHPLNRASRP
jgi:hypothetical protein